MNKPQDNEILFLDVDGVVADLHTEWLRRYNEEYNDNLKVSAIKSWGIHEYVKPECGRDIYKYLKNPDLYACTPVIEGAQDGVKELRSMGYRVVFVTAFFNTQKVEWLHNNGFLAEYPYNDNRWETVLDCWMINDKNALHKISDWMIDDRFENLEGFNKPILFDSPWNRHHNVQTRVYGWEGLVSAVVNWETSLWKNTA